MVILAGTFVVAIAVLLQDSSGYSSLEVCDLTRE